MFFWFKKSKEVLDCFTFSDYAYDYAKIDRATKYFPEWWKTTPKIYNNKVTIKSCYAFINFYKTGIVIPSWFEMKLNISKDKMEDGTPIYNWITSNDHINTEDSHLNDQFHLFAENDSCNLKLKSAWRFRSKEKIYFTWTQPTWNTKFMLKNMSILPGVIEFKYQHFTEINYLVHETNKDVLIEIPAQTPLVMLHPMTEKEIEIRNHRIDKEEFDRMGVRIHGLFFNDSAEDKMNFVRRKKKIIDQTERKCPFGYD